MRRLFTLPLLVIFCTAARPQQLSRIDMPNSEQMPTAFVHRFLEDRDGFMWYATSGAGLCRDNGYQIDVFRTTTDNGRLFGQDIICMDADSAGNIWFGTEKGLYVLTRKDYSIRGSDVSGLESGSISAIHVVRSRNEVWVASGTTIYRLSGEGQLLRTYPSVWQGKEVYLSNFYEDSRGQLWLTQWRGGLLSFDRRQNRWIQRNWPLAASPNDLLETGQKDLYWVATWGAGIVLFHAGDMTSADRTERLSSIWNPSADGSSPAKIVGLLKDWHTGLIWATTVDGAVAFDEQSGHRLRPHDTSQLISDKHENVDGIYQDHRGNIWVASSSPRTYVLTPATFEGNRYSSRSRDTGHGLVAYSIANEGSGIWMANPQMGVTYYSRADSSLTVAHNLEGEPLNFVHVLRQCLKQNGVWVDSRERLYRVWHEGTAIRSELIVALKEDIHSLCENPEGELWIGTDHSCLLKNIHNGNLISIANNVGNVNAICSVNAGRAYLISDNSKLISAGKGMKPRTLATRQGLSDLAADGSTIWMSTYDGYVLAFDTKRGTWVDNAFPNSSDRTAIQHIGIDRNGHIWALSELKVMEYVPSTGILHTFNCSDPAIRMDFFKSMDFHHGDTVLIGGAPAACAIKSSAMTEAESLPPRVTSIRMELSSTANHDQNADTRQIQMSGERRTVDVPATCVNVDIMLSTLDIVRAGSISFAYRIRELDKTWIYLAHGLNVVRLTNLHKGRYTMEVMATDRNGIWGQPHTCLTINRLPAWWESWWAETIYALTGTVLIVFVLALLWHRQRRRRQEEIDRKVTEFQFRFFTNVSHELRTPLTLIMTPLESLRQAFSADKAREVLPVVYDNARNLLTLVNRLLDFRRIETGEEQLNLSDGDVFDFLRSEMAAFQPMAEKKRIYLHCDVPQQALYMKFDHVKLHHIMSNLQSNALKFTNEEGSVTLSASHNRPQGTLLIKVADTGIGISQTDLPHVFDRFYQSADADKRNRQAGGFGIGLHIVKDYVEKHGGSITVESQEHQGTTFSVTLPTRIEAEQRTGTERNKAGRERNGGTKGTAGAVLRSNRHTVLLVDDQKDFCTFLSAELKNDYDILEAADGVQAEQMANENVVDIVVSDVMMPEMDGFELCRRLKENERTSHIFVILLTAKSGQESELEGYTAGADCYLSKPFNMTILRNRIEHFTDIQQKRFRQFSSDKEIHVEQLDISTLDQKILNHAIQLVETHIGDENYSIEDFSSDMCMSRMNLYRKLQSIAGQTPLEFMKAIRLKKAACLLREGELSVTEISERVGFGTLRNFRKNFKDFFGVVPSEYH